MSPQTSAPVSASSDEALDGLAVTLVQQCSLLSRLVFARLDVELTRSEASLLARLEAGPERITALAELDGLAQPTVTLLVKRLAAKGLVARERPLKDGRVVLVSLTASGRRALELVRRRYRERLRACLADLPEQEVAALERGIGAMESLIGRLQREEVR